MSFIRKTSYESFSLNPDLLDIESYYYATQRKNVVYPYRYNHPFSWFISIFSLMMLSTLLMFIYLTDDQRVFFNSVQSEGSKNIVMMISDGFGPASETFARQYYTWKNDLEVSTLLPLDEIHIGQSRTQSSSSLVTDSAAGATAFSCAKKSHNGAIGVNPQDQPCGTVLESAKIHHNMLTGLVVTSRVTHATPAAFSAHVPDRDQEDWIAEQQVGFNPLGRTVDLMFGGGWCYFYGNSSKDSSCRADDRDLLEEAKSLFNWNVCLDRSHFDSLSQDTALPLMAMFSPSHMDYEIDRNQEYQPSLKEMTDKALSILDHASKESGNGFFLMIEGSRIDMAAHTNDPAAHVHDIWEYQQTVELVKSFIKDHPNTVLVSTSDHETGGFTAGRQVGDAYPEYKWNPEVIDRVKSSSENLANVWSAAVNGNSATTRYLQDIIFDKGLGITDATPEEIRWVSEWKNDNPQAMYQLSYQFSDMVSRRALIGWTTHGHTAVDVNLYAMGPGTEVLRGSHENTDIGDFITTYLDLDLDDITERLNMQVLQSTKQL
ncbi:alkaline-phosphatase-like protein [Halteromyces radiatus]|uniref:alkaline-phosphatase-like protein n=1 Tax=Halteromyces radiatus TaxID=101107 RepID=UPI0022204E1E|nr:alkaline-phosphatase-like protein [Halteromyces radiatus]KAI8088812.1 alkaline-phosphatase-like protein [Halteromyces radiatus]